ncbi:hypothetical protein [Sporosarcina sp. JAI121]|nr:hypothetical protein [Sporosarcina sp. JAI121]NYF23766.1 hypothetical protein [Sporosarcina sp. JAI121]
MKKILSILILVVVLSVFTGNQALATKDQLPKLFNTSNSTSVLLK